MSNKDLDKLTEAAFGELELSDRDLEAWIAQDDQARRLHTEMSALKTGLKSLADVPECQLSSERLREAILSQGVKPKPAFDLSVFKWAAPLAATLVAGVFYFGNLASTHTLSLSASVTPSSARSVEPSLTEDPQNLLANNTGYSSSEATRIAASGMLERALQVRDSQLRALGPELPGHQPRVRRAKTTTVKPPVKATVSIANLVAVNVTDSSTAGLADLETPGSNSLARSASMADRTFAAPVEPVAAQDQEPPVVVLGDSPLPGTRAASAVEVQKNDVVFGG